jgi:hypothetical protein
VKVVTGEDADAKSRGFTLEVLQYVHAHLARLTDMGLAVRVVKVTSRQLRDERVRAAMRARSIARLPALVTPNGVYLGFQEISSLYERNFAAYEAIARRGDQPVVGEAPTDELEDYYRSEMTLERARADDKDDDAFGEGGDMMDSYRRMMERRETSDRGHKPKTRAGAAAPGAAPRAEAGAARGAGRTAPPRTSGSGRPDNIAGAAQGGARGPPVDDEEAEIQHTIDRLARDIDDNLREAAFSSGGGDSYDDDGSPDPQDDLMEQAYWSRAADTSPGY